MQAQNEGLAKWVAAHPDRFVALASVALQHPDLAAEQLEDGVKRLGLRGASIGGHVNGEDLSLPKYDPFWAKAAELGVLVFMHPGGAENIIKEGALRGRGDLGNIIGNPLETTYFLSRLIFDGTLDKFPGLRVCGAHAGGYLPSYLGRTEVACEVRAMPTAPTRKSRASTSSRRSVVDTMVFSDEGLRHLVAEVGVGQIVYGTDVPFNWPVTVDLVLNAPFLSDADKEAILEREPDEAAEDYRRRHGVRTKGRRRAGPFGPAETAGRAGGSEGPALYPLLPTRTYTAHRAASTASVPPRPAPGTSSCCARRSRSRR